ncbi:MAG: class I SAM-dependent methyltransferase [Candidatus Omnitrophica bacterium]|nr:class I SAM-dependent methyltransferase [Candidatus Omnitrophota bacterium]
MADDVRLQKERERRLREREAPFGAFTLTAKTHWWNMVELDNVLTRLRLPHNGHLLDAGCSDGRLIERLREKGYNDMLCVGMDFALNPLKAMIARNMGAQAVCADTARPLFKKNTFDIGISLQVLHHLPSHEERLLMLRSMHGALRSGGQIAVSVLNRPSWAGLVANGIDGPLLSSPELCVHLYDRQELSDDLEAAGFRVQEILATNNLPVRYLKLLGMAGVWIDMLITRMLPSLSRRKGRYLLGLGVKR